ncbi:hypothetical protein O1R50_05250 [Glycomyces luteolus]|uniref:Transmembrane protein n=1 Tax=Glycomyces luteolus TaxID=2670330 RepID=A0A9X3P682_9ACTN|nr:hypothetical protein [Glycomyces luteolus]MDA1359017.1 hypothetical protein [Glycomyces luteolus]
MATDLSGSSIDAEMIWGFVIVMVLHLPLYLMVHRDIRGDAQPARPVVGRPTSPLLRFLEEFPNHAVVQQGSTHRSLTVIVYDTETDEEREVMVPPKVLYGTRFNDPHSPKLPPESMRTFREHLRREARIAARRRPPKSNRTSMRLFLFWSYPVVLFLLLLCVSSTEP